MLSGTTPLVAGYATQGIELFNAAVAHAPGASDQNLQPQLGGCCGYVPKMALDSAGHLWIAWYSNATGATGIYVQQLDPTTGAPIGHARAGAQQREHQQQQLRRGPRVRGHLSPRLRQLAGGRPGGHDRLLVARAGAPTTIANLAGDRAGRRARADGGLPRRRPALGRLVRRQDLPRDARRRDRRRRRGAGRGRCRRAPRAARYALKGIAVGDNLLLAANYAWAPSAQLPFALFVNTVAPPAPVTKAPGPRDVTLQAGPGKTFRIQVQYTLPKACTGAVACTLRGELRTRTGRRLYAVTPLPGDTKLVLGTRGKFAVPKGKKGKIRFYIVVSKAQLLKAPFSTEGGSRVAETRLRVWYTPKGGSEALSVRDGRIKVSIARIKSGALPGLAGIL